jgi:general secretion pathway protein G
MTLGSIKQRSRAVKRLARSFEALRGRARDCKSGFTLIEMVVVIAIIGLIMALVGPRVLNYLNEAKVKAARIQIQGFASALNLFHLDAGRYPSSAEGLAALVQPTLGVPGWNGPYLKGTVPKDPWGTPYLYRSPGQNAPYDLISYGADGREGGTGPAADISAANNE